MNQNELNNLYVNVMNKLASANPQVKEAQVAMQKTAAEKNLDEFYGAVITKLASMNTTTTAPIQKTASTNDIDTLYRGVMGILANRG